MNDIVDRFRLVKQNIDALCDDAEGGSATKLVVVSKLQSAERIRPLLVEGHRVFAESRLEEADEKWHALRDDFPDSVLHYIGALQSKKIKKIVRMFDVIQSIDGSASAARIAKEIESQGKSVECFIQINIGREAQKSGVLPEDFGELFDLCANEYRLKISGVMCIPPAKEDPSPYFSEMKKIQDKYGLAELSIGMSSDYLCAISHGATMVRVGAQILGERI